MKKEDRIGKADEKYMEMNPVGDPGFDPDYNARVIEESIKAMDAMIIKKEHEHDEAVKERASAVATFLKSSERGGKTSNLDDYFGRRHLAYLRGQEVMARLKDGLTTYDSQGNVIRKPN